jgi:hypothetical protein
MTDAQRELRQPLKAHQSDLETERDAASDCDLNDRIEATRRVLKWLDDKVVEPQSQPEASTLYQTAGEDPSRAPPKFGPWPWPASKQRR